MENLNKFWTILCIEFQKSERDFVIGFEFPNYTTLCTYNML